MQNTNGQKNVKKKTLDKLIIEGITESGEVFRPSDWADRMSCQLASFPQKRITYSPLLTPSITKEGRSCVILDSKLKRSNPELYQSILNFAKTNRLKICKIYKQSTDT